jgi:hypothetical protein
MPNLAAGSKPLGGGDSVVCTAAASRMLPMGSGARMGSGWWRALVAALIVLLEGGRGWGGVA